MSQQHSVSDLAWASPPAAASTASLLGYPVADWVLWMNFVYIFMLLGFKLWTKLKECHNGRKRRNTQSAS